MQAHSLTNVCILGEMMIQHVHPVTLKRAEIKVQSGTVSNYDFSLHKDPLLLAMLSVGLHPSTARDNEVCSPRQGGDDQAQRVRE